VTAPVEPDRTMVEIYGLSKRFGPITAVDGITFTVGKGEVLGFLGPNGAGKSTTMKMLTGFLVPSAGLARVMGLDVVEDTREAARRIGYLPEGAPAWGDMTPWGFLNFCADARGIHQQKRHAMLERAIDLVAIGPVLYQPIETLSKGFKRRVGLAQAILHDPPVLVMDEPTDGLDPNQKHQVRELIRTMAPDKAIIVSTHILEEVEAVCTRAVIIDRGKLVADGTPQELLARSKYHDAVSIILPPARVEVAIGMLRTLEGISAIEEDVRADGTRRVTLMGPAGAGLLLPVSTLLRDRGFEVLSARVEQGRLDEVFRTLTKPAPAENSQAEGAAA